MTYFKKALITSLAALLIISAPVQAFGAVTAREDFSLFGDKIQTSIFGETTTSNAADSKGKVKIVSYCNSAKIQFDRTYLSYKITEYNLLLDKWENVEFTNNSDNVIIKNLLPNTYHNIKIFAGNKFLGSYTFYTRPENIPSIGYDFSKKLITLYWANPHNYSTEIYRKSLTSEEFEKLKEQEELAKKEAQEQKDKESKESRIKSKLRKLTQKTKKKNKSEEKKKSEWELLDTVTGWKYEDKDIKEDTYYYYKVRYVCKNQGFKTLYSEYSTFEEMYVPVEINNILEANGYIIVRQNDPLNSTIPYPYKDNGKKLGSSGCGACSSLMIVRNMTKYEPTLEAFAEKFVEIGARTQYGTDMAVAAKYMHDEYNLNYSFTKDVEKLKKHLKAGNMAVAHVGKNKYFAKAGHFVVIAGIVKDKDQNDRAVILDPTFAKKKYDAKRRVDMGIEYSADGIVTAPFETVLADCKDEYFTLFEAK